MAFLSGEETPELDERKGVHTPAVVKYTEDSSVLLDAAVAGGRGSFCTQQYIAAASTFAVGGILVYSLTSVALQSALRNMGVLGYAIYMAMLANS